MYTIQQIAERLKIEPEKAKLIQALLYKKNVDPCKLSKACEKWVHQCYNEPSREEKIMCAIDDIIGTHGVEAIWSIHNEFKPLFTYCNAGDPYVTTVIREHSRGRWLLACWGDLVEKRKDIR